MTPERRYSDDEIAEILDRATDSPAGSVPGAPSATGMTLAELQEIGDEVGIPRGAIARAAASLDRPIPDAVAHRTFLGTTVGVGRSVDLPRPLTDEEWNRLVVDLRMTFDAKGKIRQEGAFRQWTNGNLQALLEPSGAVERLRLRTVKGSAMPGMGVGGAMMAGAAIGGLVAFFTGITSAAFDLSMLAATGAVLFGFTRIPLLAWARTREEQMEDVIARLQASVTAEGNEKTG